MNILTVRMHTSHAYFTAAIVNTYNMCNVSSYIMHSWNNSTTNGYNINIAHTTSTTPSWKVVN